MGLLSTLKNFLGSDKTIVKSPEFSVGEFISHVNYNTMIDSDKYLDQYFGWTYKAVKTKADAFAMQEVHLYAKKGDDEYELSEDNQMYKDLTHFNDYMTLTDARALMMTHKSLAGVAYWYMVKSETSGIKNDFFPLNPQKVEIKIDQYGLPSAYVYTDPSGQKHDIEPSSMIVFRDIDPRNWLKGYGTLQASRLSHNTYELAMRYNMNMFGNMGRPEGILSIEGINDTEKRAFEEKLRNKYGGSDNAGKTAVTNLKKDMISWIPLGESQRNMQYQEGILLMRDEILSLHGIPKPLVGLTDSTYTNSIEAQRVFQRNTLKPELVKEASVLNEQLIKNYFGNTIAKGKLVFLPDDPVEADKKSDAEVANILFTSKIITQNEARDMVGLEVVDDGDVYSVGEQAVDDKKEDDGDDKGKDNEEVKSLQKKIDALTKLVKDIPDVKEKLSKVRDEMKEWYYQKALEQEKPFAKTAQDYFEDQGKRILQDFKPKKSVSLDYVYDMESEIEIAIKYFKDVYDLTAKESADMANSLIGGKIEISDKAKKKLKRALDYFAGEINKTTRDDLNRILVAAVEGGKSTVEVTQEIKDLFNRYAVGGEGITETRAESIARTETGFVSNYIARDVYSQSDDVRGYEWVAARDEATRDAHARADGQTRAKGFKFLVGGEQLIAPGDKAGSAGNVINCRCRLAPVVE